MTRSEDDAPYDHQDEASAGADIVRFWEISRGHAGLGRLDVITGSSATTAVPPPTWAFGSTPDEADHLLALVLEGTKTATASAHWQSAQEDEQLPRTGDLSIVLDGEGRPRALVRTTAVEIVPFDEVGDDHAHAEGEGDLSLAYWRDVHERFFREELQAAGLTFDPHMQVVTERLELLHPRRQATDDLVPAPA